MTGNSLAAIDALIAAGLDLVVIGGLAVNAHGFARATEDTDVVLRRDEKSLPRLLSALKSINAFYITDQIDPATGMERIEPVSMSYIRSHSLMMMGSDHGYINLFVFIPGMPNEPLGDLFATRVVVGGRAYCSLEWLRRMKRASGRPRDLLDLEALGT